jgi:hypothetical protein
MTVNPKKLKEEKKDYFIDGLAGKRYRQKKYL